MATPARNYTSMRLRTAGAMIIIAIIYIVSLFWGFCFVVNYGPTVLYYGSTVTTRPHVGSSATAADLSSDEEIADRIPRIVFSLTTSPKRLHQIQPTIESLLAQEIPADLIQLNLPNVFRRTGETYNDLGSLEFLKHPKIRINRCEDYGPATKLIPTVITEKSRHVEAKGELSGSALRSNNNAAPLTAVSKGSTETLVIIVDDDTLYQKDLTKVFVKLSYHHPERVVVGHCGDTYLTSGVNTSTPVCNMFEAYAGVGFRQSFFDQNKDDFQKYMTIALQNSECFRSDDYVVSNYFALRGRRGVKAERFISGGPVQLDVGKGDDALHKLAWSEANHDVVYGKCEQYLRSKNLAVLKIKPPHVRTWNELIPRRYQEWIWDRMKSVASDYCY